MSLGHTSVDDHSLLQSHIRRQRVLYRDAVSFGDNVYLADWFADREVVCCFVFFFFSSRRRHTRFDCDWSSDVCSSDLKPAQSPFLGRLGSGFRAAQREESSLNRISLWVNVTLRNRDRAMPCDPRQRERIATGLGKASESRVPEDVGLKALYN